jgi:hypothetical protein
MSLAMYLPVTLIKVMLIAMLLNQKILYDIDPIGQCLKTSFGVILSLAMYFPRTLIMVMSIAM